MNASDTLQLQYGTHPSTGQVIPFVLTKIVFIQTNKITVIGDNPPPPDPITPPSTLIECAPGLTVGFYISALGSSLQHFQLSGCTQTAVTYDFESPSAGHTITGVYFNNNYKAIGAEGCTLEIGRSWFMNGVSGAIVSGSANLTLRGNKFSTFHPLRPRLLSSRLVAASSRVFTGSCFDLLVLVFGSVLHRSSKRKH